MVILVLIIVLVLLLAVLGAVFLLGYRIGGDSQMVDLARVRQEATQAERRLHQLTREAFVSMAELAERRQHDRHP